MHNNKIEFPSEKDAQALKKSVLDYYLQNPQSYCFTYQWLLGVVLPKSEKEYIQSMFRYSTEGVSRRCDFYLKNSISYLDKEYVLRLESYGDSKKNRMSAGVNPLAYAFGKIMLDHVYLFIEEKNESCKNKMQERIDRQIVKERYFTAQQNMLAHENIFDVKFEDKKKICEEGILEQKQSLSSVEQSIKNIVLNIESYRQYSKRVNQNLKKGDEELSKSNLLEKQDQIEINIYDEKNQKQALFQKQSLLNQRNNGMNEEENENITEKEETNIIQSADNLISQIDSNQQDESPSQDDSDSQEDSDSQYDSDSQVDIDSQEDSDQNKIEEEISDSEENIEQEIDDNLNKNIQKENQSYNTNEDQQIQEIEVIQRNENIEEQINKDQKCEIEQEQNIQIEEQNEQIDEYNVDINSQEEILDESNDSTKSDLNGEQHNRAIQKTKSISKDKNTMCNNNNKNKHYNNQKPNKQSNHIQLNQFK